MNAPRAIWISPNNAPKNAPNGAPQDAPPVAWDAIIASLRIAQRQAHPHLMSGLQAPAGRRAAVAVVLWGDADGARQIVLVQRGFDAPRHAGELAFPGGMVEASDRDLPATARRELAEELGITKQLWELGCFPDAVARSEIRFTPVFFRWDAPQPHFETGPEIHQALLLPLRPLLEAPWTTEVLQIQGQKWEMPRLELPSAPLWGATALVLRRWLDGLQSAV